MKNSILALVLLLSTAISFAQKEAAIWYFGKKAGVSFAGTTPLALTDGKLSTEEGCVTISDKTGKLLFYTDGITLYNANHAVMPNGNALKGHPSSTQSGVVIAKPGASNKFYLFTVTATAQADGFCYSEVDMTLDNGLGDVVSTVKNISLRTPVTEKLTAVKHRNNKDTWVLVHDWNSDEFAAFLVTANGVNTTAIISKGGSVHKGSSLNTQGYMKSNPDGSNIALALEETDQVEIFDFNNETGIVSKPISIQMPKGSYVYGVEFSPNGSLLYATAAGTGIVYQYNLQAGTEDAISKSQTQVGKTPGGEWLGALQLAPDGKIYIPVYQKPLLAVIENPNTIGTECGYKNEGVKLETGISQLGLPTFNQTYFIEEVEDKKVTYFNDQKIELGKALVLKNLLFDHDKTEIKASSNIELDKIYNVLKANPTYKIKINGHTDNIGNKSYNLRLSQSRSESVKIYLVKKGIDQSRISCKGFGSTEPVADNNTEAGRATNRRVEMIIDK